MHFCAAMYIIPTWVSMLPVNGVALYVAVKAQPLAVPEYLQLSSHPMISSFPPWPLSSILLGRERSLLPAINYSPADSAAVHPPGSGTPSTELSQFLRYSRNFWKQQIEMKVWEPHIVLLTGASMLTTTESLLIPNKKSHPMMMIFLRSGSHF